MVEGDERAGEEIWTTFIPWRDVMGMAPLISRMEENVGVEASLWIDGWSTSLGS